MASMDRSEEKSLSLVEATHETFEQETGTTFRTDAYGPLRLVSVHVSEHSSPSGGRRPFTLTFVSEPDRREPQGMARMEHDTLGPLEIFIVPIGPNQNGAMRYEAVFS